MVPLDAMADAALGFRKVLVHLAAEIDINRNGAIDGTDPEALHELRVAIRRTRSVLSAGREVLPKDVRDRYREGFTSLGKLTGRTRDLDIVLLGWDEDSAALAPHRLPLDAVRKRVEERRSVALATLAEDLGGRAVSDLLDGWQSWLIADSTVADADRPLGPVVAARIEQAQHRLLRHGREIRAHTAPEHLHDLRKDAKKVRYLVECFSGLLAPKRRKRLVVELKSLQDSLGRYQDAEVKLGVLRDVAHELGGSPPGTDAVLAIGYLSGEIERGRAAERAQCAARFEGYDSKANHKAVTALLRPLRR